MGPGEVGLGTAGSGFQARPACPAAYSSSDSLPSAQASQEGKQGGGWGTPWQGPLCLLWSGGLGGCESESHDHDHDRGIPQLLPSTPLPAEGMEKGLGGGVSEDPTGK